MANNPIRCNYPLHWPEGWKRTSYPKTSQFDRARTMAQARDFLLHELRLLGALAAEISTNVRVRPDGLPYSGQAQPTDKGAVVYFKLRGKDYALACDRWNRVECNIYAIGKHVEAMRAQERYGVGSQEQALQGYQLLLPAAGTDQVRNWWNVLGVPPGAGPEEIDAAYRERARTAHPDAGGTHAAMAELNAARAQGLTARGAR